MEKKPMQKNIGVNTLDKTTKGRVKHPLSFEPVSKCFPLTAGFEIKSKIPDFERGKAIRLRRINHPSTICQTYGDPISDKRGRFEIRSFLQTSFIFDTSSADVLGIVG